MWIMVSELSLSIYHGDKHVKNMCRPLDISNVHVVHRSISREDNDCRCTRG